jgi:ribosomal RNA-processing protein 9
VSDDRSFKIWDANQAAYMENFYGHRSTVLEVDILSKDFMISSSYDKRPIIWKIP